MGTLVLVVAAWVPTGGAQPTLLWDSLGLICLLLGGLVLAQATRARVAARADEYARAEADHADLLARERCARAEAEALAALSAAVASSQDPAEVLTVAVGSLPRLV